MTTLYRAIFVACSVGSLLLCAAGLLKFMDYSSFHDSLQDWQLLEHEAIMTLAMIAPFFELLFAALWLMGFRRRMFSVFIVTLIAMYTIALAIEHNISGTVNCNCFSLFSDREDSWSIVHYVVRNMLLMLPFTIHASWKHHASSSATPYQAA